MVNAVPAVDFTAAATVFTSEGSFDVAPVVPLSPSQKFAHARASLSLTVAGAAPVAVPPSMAWTVESTTVCRFVVAVFAVVCAATAFPSAVTAFPSAVTAFASAVAALVRAVPAVVFTAAAAVYASAGNLVVLPVVPFRPS